MDNHNFKKIEDMYGNKFNNLQEMIDFHINNLKYLIKTSYREQGYSESDIEAIMKCINFNIETDTEGNIGLSISFIPPDGYPDSSYFDKNKSISEIIEEFDEPILPGDNFLKNNNETVN